MIYKMKLIQLVQTVIYMYTLYSNQIKKPKTTVSASAKDSMLNKEMKLLIAANRFIKLNQDNREGYKSRRPNP